MGKHQSGFRQSRNVALSLRALEQMPIGRGLSGKTAAERPLRALGAPDSVLTRFNR
jgi:hypothetical protein